MALPFLGVSLKDLAPGDTILQPSATIVMPRTAPDAQDLSSVPWDALPPGTAAALRPGLARTADDVIEAIRAAVPAYARPLEGSFGEGIRTGVARALEQFVSAAEGYPRRPGGARDIYFELGRGEAREGRSLDALLAAYRVGARVAWRNVAAGARDAGLGAEALAPLAEAVFAFIDELSARSAEGYAYEQSAAAGEAAARRRALVQLMVARPPADPAAVEHAAREAGWRLPARLAAVVWPGGSEQRPPALPPGSLAAALGPERLCALVPDPGAPGRPAELERSLAGRGAALGPEVGWQEAWRSAERALHAQELQAEGILASDGLLVTDRHLPELALLRERRLLDELAARALAPLDGRTRGSRGRLLETLRAWLDHQGRVPEAAAALHVHPQTVRYRLARLREAFGPRLDDPDERFALALALRAPAAQPPPRESAIRTVPPSTPT
jgi:hypothetical protein